MGDKTLSFTKIPPVAKNATATRASKISFVSLFLSIISVHRFPQQTASRLLLYSTYPFLFLYDILEMAPEKDPLANKFMVPLEENEVKKLD